MAHAAVRKSLMGQPRPRVEGRLKVTGEAMYPSDVTVPNPAYAFLVTSSIAKGKIRQFHLKAAHAVPGVLDILTFENTKGAFKTPPNPGGVSGGTTTTLESAKIWHDGQIIAVVVAVVAMLSPMAMVNRIVRIDSVMPTAETASDPRLATKNTLTTPNSDSMIISSTIGTASSSTARLSGADV